MFEENIDRHEQLGVLITQLEHQKESVVLTALTQLGDIVPTPEFLIILGLVYQRWHGYSGGGEIEHTHTIPLQVEKPSEQIQNTIRQYLEKTLPMNGLPAGTNDLLKLCWLFARGLYLSVLTHGEMRYPEINPNTLEIYATYQATFEAALELSGIYTQEFILFAQILWSYHRSVAAEPFLKKALELLPDQPLHYHHRWCDWNNRNYTVDFKAHNSFTWYYWAEYQRYVNNNLTVALHAYQQFLEFEPSSNPAPHMTIQENYINTCNYAPSNTQAWLEIGKIYQQQQQLEAAENAYRKSIDLAKNSQSTPYLLLIQLLEQQHQETTTEYQKLWLICQQHRNEAPVPLEVLLETQNWLREQLYVLCQKDLKSALRLCKDALSFAQKIALELNRIHKFDWRERIQPDQVHLLPRREKQLFPWAKMLEKREQQNQWILELRLLHARIALEGHKDYWQARSLYEKILLEHPEHPEAFRQLEQIRLHLGY